MADQFAAGIHTLSTRAIWASASPAELTDDDLLAKLLALNLSRAASASASDETDEE